MTFRPGETVFYDRALRVIFLKELPGGQAIVKVGADSRVVYLASLSSDES